MLLKKLTEAAGVSGRENEIRNIIREELVDHVDEIKTDTLGNLIVHNKGKKNKPEVMLTAHMDEIGLMITNITEDGFLKFKPVGGIDKRVLVAKKVIIGEDKIPGVIGAKAIHLQKPDERKKVLDYKNLYIDIGAKNKEECEKIINLGDMATFSTKYRKLGQETAKGKAFDDRVGCAILIELLKRNYNFSLTGVFTVQEEVGARGAATVAYSIDPDLALVIESTTAADVPDNKEAAYSTKLGSGPALTMRDASTIPNPDLVEKLIEVAKEKNLSYQFRKSTKAGNDAGVIHLAKKGISTAVVSVPSRYIHSPVSLINLDDYQTTIKLIDGFCQLIEQGGLDYERFN